MPERTEPIPDYGDTFTVAEFQECVEDGGFIDYDGHGYYSDGKVMFKGHLVMPSTIKGKDVSEEFSHVVWFNR